MNCHTCHSFNQILLTVFIEDSAAGMAAAASEQMDFVDPEDGFADDDLLSPEENGGLSLFSFNFEIIRGFEIFNF